MAAQSNVRARRVGDSVVITLTKPILDSAGIAEGDSLLLEALSEGRILVAKEEKAVSVPKRLELELDLLKSRKAEIEAEMNLGIHEYNSSMPTAHPGIQDSDIAEGCFREWTWESRKLDVEIAQKRLQLFELTGQAEGASEAVATDNVTQITEVRWRTFLRDRTDLQLDVIKRVRSRGGEVTLRELGSVTNGDNRKLSGVIGSLNRLSQRLWGVLMIEPRQRVLNPEDGVTEYGYSFHALVPWQVE